MFKRMCCSGWGLTLAMVWASGTAQAAPATTNPPPRAPEFAKVEWLNTDKPLTLESLRGQVVLLDFWTYCCINCMHILPDLKYLETKYRDQPLVVIGVHSGKFSQEKDAENIRSAILRHNIGHPVAVDNDYAIWKAYGVNSWPTLVVIDPEGYVYGAVSGEGHRDLLDRTIGKVLLEARAKGTLATKPLRFRMEREAFKSGVLEFPGKVLADAEHKRLFISDTNHHRVLVADLDGHVQTIVGTGQPGLVSGTLDKAQFRQPQGLALSADGNRLYVADTENHALRAVDLSKKIVLTLAGNGKQATSRTPNGPGHAVALNSPWDLARVGDRLYIANAGSHQIWAYDVGSARVTAFAGNGQEATVDGAPRQAAFAQPSGLATDGKRLYVADSEASSIRGIDLIANGNVATLAGSGELFGFGRDDGQGRQARFQHPLGVALAGDRLYVADTFNHLIRIIDTNSGQVTTWFGTGKPGPGTAEQIGLYEPGGISIAAGKLYIADTNHHRIIVVDLATKLARILQVTLPPATTRPAGSGEKK